VVLKNFFALARFLDKHRRQRIFVQKGDFNLQEEKKIQIENPYPTTRKEFAYFYAPFRFPGRPCFTLAES
jgi:uncharacterized protein YifE (UPF0438 family)